MGHAGYGGVFLDHQGKLIRIYVSYIGINSNNNDEIWALLQGLIIVECMGMTKPMVEGDSVIILENCN